MNADLFPDLADERAQLSFARASRDRMIERLDAVDPEGAADEITKDYIEVTVAEALEDLRGPGAGDFFGRIDDDDGSWYVGRRHIEDESHDPVVVDWRAPIAAPFYRATAVDPLGVAFRRRFTLDEGELVAYLDEDLDDPEAGGTAAGIPDPVLAEIGAERSGEMREIVATIQGEQDVVIRSDIDQVLIVQGGPGTGKTAVALHRAAYLLFEHRGRLARDGVLVVGPNRAFLDYIGNVLPSLGERTVRQSTVDELCIPKVDVTTTDDAETARWKGSSERLEHLERAALRAISPPGEDVVVPIGVRKHVIPAAEFAEWIDTAKNGSTPINERRTRLVAIARRELTRRSGDDSCWRHAGPLKTAINKAWPTQKPIKLVDGLLPGPRGKRRAWTVGDQLLVDEANSLLNGSPFTYGHVVVDEAQDHSDVALRVIGRRSPAGSMTLLGDVAQSTAPAGQERWADVFAHLSPTGTSGTIADLTIGYRVPEAILTMANRLLPLTEVDATESRSVRVGGVPPTWNHGATDDLPWRVATTVQETKRLHRLTGLVAPLALHEAIATALAEVDLSAVDHVHELGPTEVPLFEPHAAKGLEFDGVVVANPHDILGDSALGARLLYVAMTRAVQRLAFVTDAAVPAVLTA
ncbi:HelD family protein [Ilumatobacter nonamiensis]|uniref:HelD family protein n=1 Tax=Ilumatobacter nonamiensis TaxID=467093 RepID=UPI00034907C3|nr:ATP-binding domain-containing protein [Ilumatobacter nonamiensis]